MLREMADRRMDEAKKEGKRGSSLWLDKEEGGEWCGRTKRSENDLCKCTEHK